MIQFLSSQYWIARNAITFVLNAMGDPQKVSVSISSGAVVMAYMPGVEGLGYDNSHSYRRWRLRGYASILQEAVVTHEVSGEPVDDTYPATGEKYVYILIPRNTQTVGEEALIGFAPCEIDYLGFDANGIQVGNNNYYYLYTQGIISASVDSGPRSWSRPIETGTLATDEAYDSGGPNPWYEWISSSGVVKFLKPIYMEVTSWFNNLRTSAISFVGTGSQQKGMVDCVANFNSLADDSPNAIVTPEYLKDREAQIEQKYLRKDQADSTQYKLTAADLEALNTLKAKIAEIEQSLTLGELNSWEKGTIKHAKFRDDFATGDSWGIYPEGRMQLNTLEVRSSLKVLELIYNRLTATESDYVFTEGGTVEEIVSHDGDQYVLRLKKRNDTDFHAFRKGDVLRGVVNNLANLGGGQFYTSWMRVIAIDTSIPEGETERNNTITVVVYPGMSEDDPPKPVVPGGVNYPPEVHMVLQRWGNAVEPTAQAHANPDYASFIVPNNDGVTYRNTRQACWYLSSIEKRIAMLDGVDAPILRESNYTAFFGLPYNLSTFKGHTMDPTQPYLYVRGAFLQDIHYIDYQGNIIRQERNRGVWTQEDATNDPYVKNDSTFDTCYYNNRKWQVVVSQARALPPSADNADWLMLYETMTPQYRIIPSVLNVLRNPDGTTSLVNNLITCDVVVDEGGDEPRFAPETEVEVYIGVNGDTPTHVSPYRQHTIAATDHSIEFYLWNKMSEFGDESGLGDAIFAYLTGMVSVPIYERGSNGDTPTIDPETGNWIINGVVTQYPSAGDEGHSPYIGADGYWYEYDPSDPQALPSGYHKTTYYAEGNQVLAQYSEDCIDWYDVYFSGALWMRTKKTGDANWGDPFRCVGEKGEGGNYVESDFAISARLTMPLDDVSSWQDAPPATTSAKPYLWMRQMLKEWDTVTGEYTNGWDSFKFTRVTGEKGDSGVGISTMTEEYAVSEDINTLPESNAWTTLNNAKGQWDADMPVLWNRETVAYTQGKPSDVKVHILALWAEDGRSLTNIENWYKTSANSSETAGGTAQGWQKDTPNGLPFDDTHPYLWNYEKLLFSDGTSQTTTPAIKSKFSRGARGATLRGPSMWEAGKTYYSGAPGEEFIDIVSHPDYPSEMFLCKFTHTSIARSSGSEHYNEPYGGSAGQHATYGNSDWTADKPWTQSDVKEFTATKVLFAQRGSIQNVNIGDATITNATIKGTLSEEMLDTQEELDNATLLMCPDVLDPDEDEYYRNFQALDIKKGSIFIPFDSPGRNKLIFLPRYIATPITVEYGDSENEHTFTIPAYTVSGTHLTISVASPPSNKSLWSVLSDAQYKYLFGSGSTNRAKVKAIYDMGVMICADALMFTETNRTLFGGYYYGSGSNFLHGRFAYKGGSSRFIFLMPGQTLHLISVVENVNGTNCLTWYVQNASDFEPLSCYAVEDVNQYAFYGLVDSPDPADIGNVDNWQDLIVGSHKINPAILLTTILDPNEDQPVICINKNTISWDWDVQNPSDWS